MKPPTKKARALLLKLKALAERGATDGEKNAAAGRLARLKAAYDFAQPDPEDKADLFAGAFRPAADSARVYTFAAGDLEIASFVKWAIEYGTKIQCGFKDEELRVYAAPSTADKLAEIASYLTTSFRALRAQFCHVCPQDAGLFTRGLFDGMMNEERPAGQPLPPRNSPPKAIKGKGRKLLAAPPALNVHPYALALPLGKQLRFSASIDKVSADLAEQLNPKQIPCQNVD